MKKKLKCSKCKELIHSPAYRNGKTLCQYCWSKEKNKGTSLRKSWLDFLARKTENKKCKQK